MSGLEFNKIIASIIIAIIVFAIISLMGNYIVKTNTKEKKFYEKYPKFLSKI